MALSLLSSIPFAHGKMWAPPVFCPQIFGLPFQASQSDKIRQSLLSDQARAWGKVATEFGSYRASLRKMPKVQQENWLMTISADVDRLLREKAKVRGYAAHYNLNGGAIEQYVIGGGINASRGSDSAAQFGVQQGLMLEPRVWFFSIPNFSLYSVLNQTSPKLVVASMRMGSVLLFFDPSQPSVESAPQIVSANPLSAVFDKAGVGFSVDTFLLPPLEIFVHMNQRLGLKWYDVLSWNEQTLAALLFIEEMILQQP